MVEDYINIGGDDLSKQIYSLVLSDQVIEKIDREALIKGSNRSQIINDMLCQSLGIWTPDLKMNRVMDLMSEALREVETMQMVSASRGNTLQIRTSVAYKYNPKLKYVIEMSGKGHPTMAILKIYSRTTSELFLQALVMFFGYLNDFEERIKANINLREVSSKGYVFDERRFVKEIQCDWITKDVEAEAIASYLSNYVQFLDESIKMYFNAFGDWQLIDQQMNALYKKYL